MLRTVREILWWGTRIALRVCVSLCYWHPLLCVSAVLLLWRPPHYCTVWFGNSVGCMLSTKLSTAVSSYMDGWIRTILFCRFLLVDYRCLESHAESRPIVHLPVRPCRLRDRRAWLCAFSPISGSDERLSVSRWHKRALLFPPLMRCGETYRESYINVII